LKLFLLKLTMTLPNIDFAQKNYLINKSPPKFELPFVKINLGRKNESANILGKMNNSKRVVKKHLDTLLLTGFEGTFEDLNKVYMRNEKLRRKKNRDKKRNNSSLLLRSDLLYKSIHLTKVKEFNFSNKKKENKNMNKTVLNIYKIKNLDNKENKIEKENNKNNINDEDISNLSTVINPKNSDLSITNNKDNTIKKKKLKFNGIKKIKIIRNILTKKSNNLLKDIDTDIILKTSKEKEENKDEKKKEELSMAATRLNFAKTLLEKNKHKCNYNNSADDINEIFDKFLKKRNDRKELKKVCGSLADGFREGLKEVKRDIGQYIWIKRSTANLISFGNSFKLMADDIFYKEHKRIIEKYPSLERDAKIILPKKIVKDNRKIINKMEDNEKKIKNIFDESEKIVKGVHLKLSKYSMKYSNSQPSIFHKKKKF